MSEMSTGPKGETGPAGPKGEPGPARTEDPYEAHLTRIEEVLTRIWIYVVSFLVMALIFGLAFTAILFYSLVIRPMSGNR